MHPAWQGTILVSTEVKLVTELLLGTTTQRLASSKTLVCMFQNSNERMLMLCAGG